jgi:ATP-dependent Lon protease
MKLRSKGQPVLKKRKVYYSESEEESLDSDDSLNDFIVNDGDESMSSESDMEESDMEESDIEESDIEESVLYSRGSRCLEDCQLCSIQDGHKVYKKFKKDSYFKTLSENERISYVKSQSEINEYDNQLVPIKYRVLSSSLDRKSKSIILHRINEFEKLSSESSEYGKLKKWIDGISKIPFGTYVNIPLTLSNSDDDTYKILCHVNIILNKCIYGQLNAKNKILQILAKLISNPNSKGNPIALIGPPGTGKTSLIKDGLANALNLAFCFITLGGASDASVLEGHSFTYEGSTWGRVIDMLMQAKCMNPIIFFDELDKISKSEKGQEIVNSLIHLTDKTQNDKFHDVYFGLDFDLSRATMIFSCNNKDEISYILNDRIEYIEFTGFSNKDKVEIAKDYLIPDICENTGLKISDILLDKNGIEYIIKNYTREDGVRKLKECLDIIYSKINLLTHIKKNDEMQIPYFIDNFKLPIQLNNNLIKKLLK